MDKPSKSIERGERLHESSSHLWAPRGSSIAAAAIAGGWVVTGERGTSVRLEPGPEAHRLAAERLRAAGKEPFFCTCGEVFDVPVWHCLCGAHTPNEWSEAVCCSCDEDRPPENRRS
jgi:hypothetical protein